MAGRRFMAYMIVLTLTEQPSTITATAQYNTVTRLTVTQPKCKQPGWRLWRCASTEKLTLLNLKFPSLKTVWTAEISWTTQLNFGELISKASLVYLKSSSEHCLQPGARQALNEFLAWPVVSYVARTSDDNFENHLFANANLDLSESRP